MTFTLGHMGLLAAQATGLGVHGATKGVVAALQPRGAQDTGREVKLHQLGPQTHTGRLYTPSLYVYSG